MPVFEVICENGLCRLVEDAPAVAEPTANVLCGLTSSDAFLAFLQGTVGGSAFDAWSWAVIPLAILGGFAMNLTPCVLPMVPVNLMVIGRSARNGLWYGLGMMVAYGALGLLAALGGVAFGSIQGNAWFDLGVAVLFVVLALAMSGVITLDLSRYRRFNLQSSGSPRSNVGASGGCPLPLNRSNAQSLKPLLLGVVSALLAGACVAPVMVSVLLLTTRLYSEGHHIAVGLPFLVGFGMALPWPLIGAGMHALPKPGPWMKYVNRIFSLIVLALAVRYAYGAAVGFGLHRRENAGIPVSELQSAIDAAKRPVLVKCSASWCGNCPAMDRVIASDPRIAKAMERFTVIRVDAEDIGELRKVSGFGSVQGLPAFVIIGGEGNGGN